MKRMISVAIVAGLISSGPALAADGCDTVLKVSDWSIKPIDKTTNHMTETLSYGGEKGIRLISGKIIFSDALGGTVGVMAIDRDAHIKPGGSYTQKADWGPFTFERLLKLDRADVTASACVDAVVYDDGSKAAFAAK